MSRSLMAFQFNARRASAVVRQSGPGRSRLHVDLGAGGGGGGLTGRRGWRESDGYVPTFLEFWGLAPAESRTNQNERAGTIFPRHRHHTGPFFQSAEFFIFVLGLASLFAFIVFVCDMIGNRPFRPMAVLVFVASGTYCLALIKQQRDLAAAERALVIEITGGSTSRASRRQIISKEDRRDRFHYFTFHQSSRIGAAAGASAASPAASSKDGELSSMETAVAAAGAAAAYDPGSGGGKSSGGVDGTGSCSPLPVPGSGTAVPPSQPCAACARSVSPPRFPGRSAETILDEGDEELGEGAATTGVVVGGVVDVGKPVRNVPVTREEQVMAEPSSGAAASSLVTVASGVDEEERAIRAVGGHDAYRGPGSNPAGAGSEQPEELEEKETPERGVRARGVSEEWSTAESCIVCFGDYNEGDILCRLPCRHTYHAECIDAWLDGPDHAWCPLCKSSLLQPATPCSATITDDNGNVAANTANMGHDAV